MFLEDPCASESFELVPQAVFQFKVRPVSCPVHVAECLRTLDKNFGCSLNSCQKRELGFWCCPASLPRGFFFRALSSQALTWFTRTACW